MVAVMVAVKLCSEQSHSQLLMSWFYISPAAVTPPLPPFTATLPPLHTHTHTHTHTRARARTQGLDHCWLLQHPLGA